MSNIKDEQRAEAFLELVDIIKKLRAPNGCPWDKEQTHESILDALIEEVYEFVDSVTEGDSYNISEELGDLLLHIVFHSSIAEEEKTFDILDVLKIVNEKLIRRHPHVFGNEKVDGVDDVVNNWDKIKKTEKGKENRKSALDGIPDSLPALQKAEKLQKRAAKVGFDWDNINPVLDKIKEEYNELVEAINSKDKSAIEHELGDICFAVVNAARHLNLSTETSLLKTNKRFSTRFRRVEELAIEKKLKLEDMSLDEMDKFWDIAKAEEQNLPKVN